MLDADLKTVPAILLCALLPGAAAAAEAAPAHVQDFASLSIDCRAR